MVSLNVTSLVNDGTDLELHVLAWRELHPLSPAYGCCGIESLLGVRGRPEPGFDGCPFVVFFEIDPALSKLLDLKVVKSSVDHAKRHLEGVLDSLELL